jgi:hypothetical protein
MNKPVTFCAWCQTPNKPDRKHHPNGQVEHKPSNPLNQAYMREIEDKVSEIMAIIAPHVYGRANGKTARGLTEKELREAILDEVRTRTRMAYAEAGIV